LALRERLNYKNETVEPGKAGGIIIPLRIAVYSEELPTT
jgi:hypothetical protein